MPRALHALHVVGLLCALVSPASAQLAPGPPGPYVIDVRGTVVGLPTSPAFYPALGTNAIVPARAFGLDVGGHLLFATLGPARLGAGANLLLTRGTSIDAVSSMRIIAPQASLNFGHADGWSYLSAGIGGGAVHARLAPGATGAPTVSPPPVVEGTSPGEVSPPLLPNLDVRTRMRSWNVGGGARWFISRHVAVGFDVRFHRLGQGTITGTAQAIPGSMVVAISAGLSLR